MGSIIQEIQFVHSLRKNIRDPKIPSTILASIEGIHRCIKNGTDQNGWKTVDWRGSRSGAHSSQKGGPYFTNRASHPNTREHAPSGNSTFTNRGKVGTPQDPPASIPLTNVVSVQKGNGAWHEHNDGFRPHQKYVSKFKKTAGKVEDTILNTILLGKLNKFSQPNYNEIKEFITHIIDNGQTDMIKCFMKLVFEKAASEEVFCPLYARLLSELSTSYPVLLTEMTNLYSQYMEIFEEVVENQTENYNEMCKRNVEKKYRRGYSQFLAELIKHNVIDQDTFMKIITTIIRQIELNAVRKESTKLIEEFADCFMKIMKAIRVIPLNETADEASEENTIQSIRSILKSDFLERIYPLSISNSELLGLSNKARFTFLDIYENIQQF
jgi:hypothetical protein